jgi:hypothetical protein
MKRTAHLWAFLFLLCSSNLSSQSLFIGGTGLYSEFNFSVNGVSQSINGQNEIWVSPSIGFEFPVSEKIHAGMKADFIVLSEGLELFDGYYFDYSFGRLTTYLRYQVTGLFDVRLGMPIAYAIEARQYNNYGSLDLILEGNVPSLFFGASAELGCAIPMGEKFELQIHTGYFQFLNSLDTDLNQRLTAYSYVFNAQLHYHL